MNVIFSEDSAIELKKQGKILLELDTVSHPGQNISAMPVYAIAGPEDIAVMGLIGAGSKVKLHEALIKNYRKRDWGFCKQAISELKGFWPKLVDEFYDELLIRIDKFETNPPPADWDYVVDLSKIG